MFPKYLIKIIDSYLEDRVLLYETNEGEKQYKISAGVPQGSVIGPFLWNPMYDDLLKLELPEECKLVGYADDVALVVYHATTNLVEIRANDSLGRINRWLTRNHLQLSANKTEAILVTKRRTCTSPKISVNGYEINFDKSLRYLGVFLDGNLSFSDHIERASNKALGTATRLACIMPNLRGPGQTTRKLISGVAYSQMMYGAIIWGKAARNSSLLHRQI